MSDPFKTSSSAELRWDVFVAPSKPVVTDDVPPGLPRRMWSPTSATLISGKRDAVIVDPLMTVEETHALSDWIAATGKHLITIYVTHGHGDHSFGISTLRERFPDARAIATPRVLQHMRKQAAPDFLQSFWRPRFPRQLPEEIVFPDALGGDTFDLEGNHLVAVDLGHTTTTCTCTSPSPVQRAGASGSRPSTRSSHCGRARWSPDTSVRETTTTLGSSRKPGDTFATSIAPWKRRPRRENCTTRCALFIRIASTPARCGPQRAP